MRLTNDFIRKLNHSIFYTDWEEDLRPMVNSFGGYMLLCFPKKEISGEVREVIEMSFFTKEKLREEAKKNCSKEESRAILLTMISDFFDLRTGEYLYTRSENYGLREALLSVEEVRNRVFLFLIENKYLVCTEKERKSA